MALQPSAGASKLAIEIDGGAAEPLRSVVLPNWRVQRQLTNPGSTKLRTSGAVSLGTMAAQFALPACPNLAGWMSALMARQSRLVSGTVRVLDVNYKEQRRIEFTQALLTSVQWPVLSATASKLPFTVGLVWQPGQVGEKAAAGDVVRFSSTKTKALLTSNFRVVGLPFDSSFVSQVDLPTVSAQLAPLASRLPEPQYAAVDCGEVRLVFASRGSPEVMDWVRKVLADGMLTAAEDLDFSVEMLDATLSQVLATLKFSGCGLLAVDQSPLDGSVDLAAGVSLRLVVGSLSLSMAAPA